MKIPCTRYERLNNIITDPQIEHRGFLIEAQDQSDQYQVCGNPSKFSKTETCINKMVPDIGEHNTEILGPLRNNQGKKINDFVDRPLGFCNFFCSRFCNIIGQRKT